MISTDTLAAAGLFDAVRRKPVYRMFAPPGAGKAPAILVLGGGDGGIGYPTSVAARLAPEGYNVMALAYFGAKGTPAKLVEIELEYFEQALALLTTDARTDTDRGIGVFAISKGVEAAFLLAAERSGIRAIVAAAQATWSGKACTTRTSAPATAPPGRGAECPCPSSPTTAYRAQARSNATNAASPPPRAARIAACPWSGSRRRS